MCHFLSLFCTYLLLVYKHKIALKYDIGLVSSDLTKCKRLGVEPVRKAR